MSNLENLNLNILNYTFAQKIPDWFAVFGQDYLLTVNLVFHYSLGVSTQTLIDKLTGFYFMCISEQEK